MLQHCTSSLQRRKGYRLRGQVFLAQGKLLDAEREIEKALETALEIGNPPQLWKTYSILGDLHVARQMLDEAREAYQNALSEIKEVTQGLDDKGLKGTFLNSKPIKLIEQKVQALE